MLYYGYGSLTGSDLGDFIFIILTILLIFSLVNHFNEIEQQKIKNIIETDYSLTQMYACSNNKGYYSCYNLDNKDNIINYKICYEYEDIYYCKD